MRQPTLAGAAPRARPRRATSRRLALLLMLPALLLAAPSAAVAQGGAEATPADSLPLPLSRLRPGSRVRLRAPETGGLLLAGTVDALRGDSLVVRGVVGLPPLLVPVASLSRLDVHREDPDRARVVATLGVIGALTGGGLYLKWCLEHREACRNDGRGDPDDPSDDSTAFNRGTAMLYGGAIVGGLIGMALTPGRWEPVRLPLRLGVVPRAPEGLGVVAGFSFGPRPLRR